MSCVKLAMLVPSGTVNISGRGVITSRTTMSPNSTTERTSARSLSSRMPSSSPASSRASTPSSGCSSSSFSRSARAAMESSRPSSSVTGSTRYNNPSNGQRSCCTHKPRVRANSTCGSSRSKKTTINSSSASVCRYCGHPAPAVPVARTMPSSSARATSDVCRRMEAERAMLSLESPKRGSM